MGIKMVRRNLLAVLLWRFWLISSCACAFQTKTPLPPPSTHHYHSLDVNVSLPTGSALNATGSSDPASSPPPPPHASTFAISEEAQEGTANVVAPQPPPPPPPSSPASSSSSSSTLGQLRFREATSDAAHSAVVGVATGISVIVFKSLIALYRDLLFSEAATGTTGIVRRAAASIPPALYLAAVPALGGGAVVSLLRKVRDFPAGGLRSIVSRVDDDARNQRFPSSSIGGRLRLLVDGACKSLASVATLGSGCSLGPEGPAVEIGMTLAQSVMDTDRTQRQEGDATGTVGDAATAAAAAAAVNDVVRRKNYNRRLLACGAAAGVAAGFNAPLAGVFFALEVMEDAFDDADEKAAAHVLDNTGNKKRQFTTNTAKVAPILMASSLSALVAKSLHGEHFIMKLGSYQLQRPLVELPLYLSLGFLSGAIAFSFSRLCRIFQAAFDGDLHRDLFPREIPRLVPPSMKPVLGGLLCGIIGLYVPAIKFFGADTTNTLLGNKSLPTGTLLTLLSAKMIATAGAAASGLVGGTFAPMLFLGCMTGALFHNVITSPLSLAVGIPFGDVSVYCLIGAASVLASLYRAPITAALLLFEMTRDYGIIVPLLASAGFGSVVADVLDSKWKLFAPNRSDVFQKFKRAMEERMRPRRDQDHVSWGDLSEEW